MGVAVFSFLPYHHLTVCVSPPQIPMLKSYFPQMMVLGGGAFGRCLSWEGGAFMNGISALIKETS